MPHFQDAFHQSSFGFCETHPATVGYHAPGSGELHEFHGSGVARAETIFEPLEPIDQGCNIVTHFLNVIERNTRDLIQLEEQQIRKGGLSAFDHG